MNTGCQEIYLIQPLSYVHNRTYKKYMLQDYMLIPEYCVIDERCLFVNRKYLDEDKFLIIISFEFILNGTPNHKAVKTSQSTYQTLFNSIILIRINVLSMISKLPFKHELCKHQTQICEWRIVWNGNFSYRYRFS